MKDQTCNQTCNQFATEYITKQAAIDALRVAYWDDNIQSAKDDPCIVDAMTDWAIRQVKALPPAQPESLVNESRPLVKDLVKDTISRQAAIDYFVTNVGFHDEDGYPIEDECELREIWTGYFDGIPSAEPERPRGRWIPVDSYSAFGGDEATWMAHGNPVAFYYCSKCKGQAYAGEDGESLITDYCPNCGADMRGEQYGL